MTKRNRFEPDAAGEIEIDLDAAAAALPPQGSAEEAPPAAPLPDESVVLVYDGEVPLANFLVRRADGFYDYVHASRGGKTEPLPRAVAEQLLASGKGFRLADPASD